jgi:hypothetical protein
VISKGPGYSGDVGPATLASLSSPQSVAFDSSDNIYVADTQNNRVRLVYRASNIIVTYAGAGSLPYVGDGGQATSAGLYYPTGLAFDSNQNLYISDFVFSNVRKIDKSTLIISTYAGSGGTSGYSGDGGLAASSKLRNNYGITFDSNDDLYISDTANCVIRKVTFTTQIITTIAGVQGNCGYNNDGVQATAAYVSSPRGIYMEPSSRILYIADAGNSRIRAISLTSGLISTIVGTGVSGYNGEGGLGVNTIISEPYGIYVSTVAGLIYFTDYSDNRVRTYDLTSLTIAAYAGTGSAGFSGDGGIPTSAELFHPAGVSANSQGTIYITDSDNYRIRAIYVNSPTASPTNSPTVSPKTINTIVGSSNQNAGYSGDNGYALSARLNNPRHMVYDSSSNLYIADFSNCRVRLVYASSNIIVTYAGNGNCGPGGNGGQAISASFIPHYLALNSAEDLFIADRNYHAIRKISKSTQIISTYAGIGSCSNSGTVGVDATLAEVCSPWGIIFDASDNLYIAEYSTCVVRKVDATTNIISTIAGVYGSCLFSGDGGVATSARFRGLAGLAYDLGNDYLYVADYLGHRIRRVVISSNIISTVAGSGNNANLGDGLLAIYGAISTPYDVHVDGDGNLLIVSYGGSLIRYLKASTGIWFTIAGTGSNGSPLENVAATSSPLRNPYAVTVDPNGVVVICDSGNNVIRAISFAPTPYPTSQPSSQPSMQPSSQPISNPSAQPSSEPTSHPSGQPSCHPTSQPTVQPTSQPSQQPFTRPTCRPSNDPSSQPSMQPSSRPSTQPSAQPTSPPSFQPSSQPSTQPTCRPSSQPTAKPSSHPTRLPTTAQPTLGVTTLRSKFTLENVVDLTAAELQAMQTVIVSTVATVTNVNKEFIRDVAITAVPSTTSSSSSYRYLKALDSIKTLANLMYQASVTMQAPSQYLYTTLSSNPLFTGSSGSVGNILNNILSSGNGTVLASSLKDMITSSPDIDPATKGSLSSKLQNVMVAAVGVDDTSQSSGHSSATSGYTQTEINIIVICTTIGTFVVALATFLVYRFVYQPQQGQQGQQVKAHSVETEAGHARPSANESNPDPENQATQAQNLESANQITESRQPEVIML